MIKVIIKRLVQGVLIPLGFTTVAWVTEACIHKKILRSGTSTLIISNDVTEDIVKTSRSLEDSGLLLKGVNETILDGAKEQKEG